MYHGGTLPGRRCAPAIGLLGAGRVGFALLGALLLLTAVALARARPYISTSEFGRPLAYGPRLPAAPSVGLAQETGRAYAYWWDEEGIVRRPLAGGELQRVVANDAVEGLSTDTLADEPVLGWSTGPGFRGVRWRGETREVRDRLPISSFAVAAGPEVPVALYSTRADSRTLQLKFWSWSGETVLIDEAGRGYARPTLRTDRSGAVHLAWFEGARDRWDLFYRTLSPRGELSATVRVGPAVNFSARNRPLLELAGERPLLIWPLETEESRREFSRTGVHRGYLAAAEPGGEPREVGPLHAVSVAFRDGEVVWAEGDHVRATSLASGERRDLLWVSSSLEGAVLADVGGAAQLLWYGPVWQGYRVFGASDERPFRPGLRDRISALLNWNPWVFWEMILSAVLASPILGLLIAVLLSPILVLPVSLVSRTRYVRRSHELGLLLGAALLSTLYLLANWRMAAVGHDAALRRLLVGGPTQFLIILAVGAALAYLLRRRRPIDMDYEMDLALSAVSVMALVIAQWVFVKGMIVRQFIF